MHLDIIPLKDANEIIHAKHYLGRVVYQPKFCLATPERDAVAVYSDPVAQHFKMKLIKPLELVRLWQSDDQRRRVGAFLASSLRAVRKLSPESDCIFSYADPDAINSITDEPHTGAVYRATGWEYFGASRVTDYWLTPEGKELSSPQCYRIYRTKSIELLSGSEGYVGNVGDKTTGPIWKYFEGPGLKRIPGKPKHLYVYGLLKTPAEVREIIKGHYEHPPTEKLTIGKR